MLGIGGRPIAGVACPSCGVPARARPRPVPVKRSYAFVLLMGLVTVGLYQWYYYRTAFRETEAARGVRHHEPLFWTAVCATLLGAVVGGALMLRGGDEAAVRSVTVAAAGVVGLYLFVEVMAFAGPDGGNPILPPVLLPALALVAGFAAPTPPLFGAILVLQLLVSYFLVAGLNRWIDDHAPRRPGTTPS